MRTLKFVALWAGAGLVVAPSPAAAADPAQPAAGTLIKNDTGKRVCRVVLPTGSRFSQRVCRTAQEWQKSEDNAQRHMREATETIRDNGPGLDPPRR